MKASTIATNQKKCIVRKQREQAEQGDQVEQNLLRLVRHSFRKRVDGKVNHADGMMHATTDKIAMLKRTSVSPGAVMKNGI